MTVGNPVRLIIQFMIPMFLGNVFQQFYNIVDSIDRKSTRLNSSHITRSRMPSSA